MNPFLSRKRPMLEYLIDVTNMSPDEVHRLPKLHLVSLKISGWFSSWQDSLKGRAVSTAFKSILVSSPDLQTLHLISSPRLARLPVIALEDNEKLPAIRELVLHGYYWSPNKPHPLNCWDWSNITHLDLKRVSIVKFGQVATPEHMQQLQVFMTDGYCSSGEESIATGLICRFLNKIAALEKLSITVDLSKRDCVREIIKHGATLHTLEVHKYANVSDRVSTHSQIWTQEALGVIQRSCPRIMELTVDWGGCTMVTIPTL